MPSQYEPQNGFQGSPFDGKVRPRCIPYFEPAGCEDLVTRELVGVNEIKDGFYVLDAHFRMSDKESEDSSPEFGAFDSLS